MWTVGLWDCGTVINIFSMNDDGRTASFQNSFAGISILIGMFICSCLFARGKLFAGDVEYHRDIRPILADKCFACHGPDSGNRQANLRLDSAEGAYAALESDEALVAIRPGKPEQSEAYQRIVSTDPDVRMPPASSNLSLTPSQKQLIQKWIEQGAVYQPHWAFIPPRKSPVPLDPNDRWSRNAVDVFVLRKMKEHGLGPGPAASREQLIRRVTFDLTGLPPTLEEIDAFLADSSPDAFEHVVDRLLASPRFGERMAAEWLDVARYSDTYGFQVDFPRAVWPWRDWVIRAFNNDLPYDEFMTQQIAGDLLPRATQEQILATTFCRLHSQEAEGGSVPEEYRTIYVSDRLQTFSTAFLGMTFECCKCHDHKYDPFSQREYFQLASFFDNIDESGLYSYFTSAVPTPTLLLADETVRARLDRLQAEVQQAEEALSRESKEAEKAFQAWRSEHPSLPQEIPGELVHLDFESVKPPHESIPGVRGNAVQLTGDDGIRLEVGNFHRYEPFSVSLWINSPEAFERAVIFHRSRAWTDAGSRGYELLVDQGHLNAALVHFDPGNSIRIRTKEPLPLNSWHHVVMTYDGSSRAAGLTLYLNGKRVEVEVIRDVLTKDIPGGGEEHIILGARFRDHGFTHGKIDDVHVYSRELTPLETARLHQTESGAATPAVYSDMSEWKKTWRHTQDAVYQKALALLRERRKAFAEAVEAVPEIMVMKEMAEPRQTFVLTRGEYTLRAEPVESKTPTALSPFPKTYPHNRLGLARWMASPDHPLTARVAVNRYWQMMFGAGLVRTAEDLGNQGESPSHPELLDWLARDFIEQHWGIKRLLKMLVMTATYQQSSVVTPETNQLDPENRWLTRAYSERFTAEMLRDNALAVSGLLIEQTGGPPVKPYEMEVAFKPMPRDKGAGLYRRSLYTYWNRTGPAPVMMALDAAKRDVCQVRREKTLSPLQPLVLMNGPQFVEAARMLAERAWRGNAGQSDSALTELFRMTTSRRPKPNEFAVIQKLYRQYLEDFTLHPEQATAFLGVGDHPRDDQIPAPPLAALGSVANMLLNYDEGVFRR